MAQAGRAGKSTLCLGRTGILLPCPAAAASAPGLLRRRKGINRRFPRGRESSVFPAMGTSSAAAFASSFHASACGRNNSGTIGFKKCMQRIQNGFSSIACCTLNAYWYLKGNTGIQKAAGGCPYSFVNGVVPDFSTFSGPSKDSVSGFSTLAIGSTYGTLSRMTA